MSRAKLAGKTGDVQGQGLLPFAQASLAGQASLAALADKGRGHCVFV